MRNKNNTLIIAYLLILIVSLNGCYTFQNIHDEIISPIHIFEYDGNVEETYSEVKKEIFRHELTTFFHDDRQSAVLVTDIKKLTSGEIYDPNLFFNKSLVPNFPVYNHQEGNLVFLFTDLGSNKTKIELYTRTFVHLQAHINTKRNEVEIITPLIHPFLQKHVDIISKIPNVYSLSQVKSDLQLVPNAINYVDSYREPVSSVKLGFQLGPNFTSGTSRDKIWENGFEITDFFGGILAEFKISDMFYIQPEANFIPSDYNGDYFEIPIHILAKFSRNNITTPFIFIGPSLSFSLEEDYSEWIEETNFSINFGGGVDISLSNSIDLFVMARYSFGLTDIFKYNYFKYNTRYITLAVGLKFSI